MASTAMEEIGATPQQTRAEKSSKSTESAMKISQITAMVEQLFDIQDTYGLRPEQLKTRMKAMVEDLIGYPIERIEAAFVAWRRSQPKIPTPAHIRNLIEKAASEEERFKRLTQPNDFGPEVNDRASMTPEDEAELAKLMRQARMYLTGGTT